MRDRIKQWDHVVPMTNYFFMDEYPYDGKSVEKRLKKEGALASLKTIRERFAALAAFSAETTDKALHELAIEKSVNAGELVHPIRVAVSGSAAGPSLFHMLEVMGKERVLKRIDRTLQSFGG
jgi:glutamyl-tRNA synthetase